MRRVRDGLRPTLPRSIIRFDTGTPLHLQWAARSMEGLAAHNGLTVVRSHRGLPIYRLRSGEHAGFIRRLAQIDTGASENVMRRRSGDQSRLITCDVGVFDSHSRNHLPRWCSWPARDPEEIEVVVRCDSWAPFCIRRNLGIALAFQAEDVGSIPTGCSDFPQTNIVDVPVC
jgi:hypothetical protein